MRRRKVDLLHDDVTEAVKSKSKGILGFLVKALLSAIIDAVVKMLQEKKWVNTSDSDDATDQTDWGSVPTDSEDSVTRF